MLKKVFFIFLSFILVNNCDYKPVYSKQNKVNYKIVITGSSGDKYINNLISTNLKRTSKEESNEIINIVFNTQYKKNVLAKNSAGTITDYQTNVMTTFEIEKDNDSESFSVKEKFNFKKMADKYEEKNYEQNIKKSLANSITQKFILRLTLN